MDREDGVSGVVLLVKQRHEFRFIEAFGKRGKPGLDLRDHRLALAGQLEEDVEVLLVPVESGQEIDLAFQPFLFLLEADGFLPVLPDFGLGKLGVQEFETSLFLLEVKENLGAR
jgi:hypothetical protein